MSQKTLQQLELKDDFMFGAVMRDPKRCKPLLEHILGVQIREIRYPELQKIIDNTMDAKSVRLDVYIEDSDNTIYNIEMQTTNKKNLPKRMRYYQGMIDLNIISKGDEYNQLKKSFIIFICDYDQYKEGRYIYTFENVCLENASIRFGDETVKVVLNTKGTIGDIDEELRNALHYIGGEKPRGKLANLLDAGVKEVKNSEEWRREYMTLFMRDRENVKIGDYRRLVQQIRRKVDIMTYEEMADIYDTSISDVENIVMAIKNNPDASDEDIASIIVEES
ncbi:MAG: Rpn family recombination-promoting nuclease/putative transposase [Lachnospiraceae bacterium]|nr:Rpn family recombination-promoting nuclease/putative transposase [Lachnospiraceae bacterium]HCJ07356.1 hypothetical protein [Lachnospiraceae bacterium]